MSYKTSIFFAPALALFCIGMVRANATYAAGAQPGVVEVRSDGFPRVTVRLEETGGGALPLDNLSPDRVHVTENGEPQASPVVTQVRNLAVSTAVALALDVSSSMADAEKLKQTQTAAEHFIQQMPPRDQFAVLSFSDEVIVPQPLTADSNLLVRSINGLAAGGNARHLYEGVAQGLTQLSLGPNGPRALIVLTDGKSTTSARTLDDDVAQAVQMAVPVYAIGLGSEVDKDVLQGLTASTGGRYYSALTAQDLAPVFRQIARQLTSEYEVSWISNSKAVSGQDVSVQIQFDRRDGAPASIAFTYTPPTFGGAPRSGPANPVQALAQLAPTAAPTQEQGMVAGAVAGASALLLFLGLVGRRVNRRMQSRLTTYLAGRPDPGSTDTGLSSLSARRRRVNPLTAAAARLTARILPGSQIKRLRQRLIQAGYPLDRHVSLFLASELGLAVTLGIASFQVLQVNGLARRSPLIAMLVAGMLALFGMYVPYMWLRRRVEWRQRMLLRSLPDALDLMSISVNAGLSLDSAMAEVVQTWQGELSREFNQVLNEMSMGASRREALQNLAERTQLQDFQLLVAALLQADELGGNVSDALAIQAEQLRIRRRQAAEEKARKAPVKMLLPLVGFIFPAMFVVVLAPAMIQVFGVFGSLAHHG
jgi:tight adherence protein C